MISRAKINAASDELDEVAISSVIAFVRMSNIYVGNPAYFADLGDKLATLDGTLQAQQINAALDALEALGTDVVSIDQSKTVGTDGVIYSKQDNREALVSYILGIMYEGFTTSVYVDTTGNVNNFGNYSTGRLPIDFEGYIT